MSATSFLTISLDFELFWGVRDVYSLQRYGENILGARMAIPRMLDLFRAYGIHATWATVGFVTFENRQELLSYLPDELPGYLNKNLDPYIYLSNIGDNESEDPYHYGYSLVRAIQDTPGMEIGSHSFSHFYCLEARSNQSAYLSDLQASVAALIRLGVKPQSLVFCRNQYDRSHLQDAVKCGFQVYRGNEFGYLYEPRSGHNENLLRRAGRLVDSYIDLSGPNVSCIYRDISGLINVPSSRFLRPCGLGAVEMLRLRRILNGMNAAVKVGGGFHLWWHPHNFGLNLMDNLIFLEKILIHYRYLRDHFGMESVTMAEAARFDLSIQP